MQCPCQARCMSLMISCPSSWCESIIFGCRVLYGRACAFSNLPPTTISQLSILGSKDLILLCLCTCWPFSRYLISSPIDSTCALFTSWFWAVLSFWLSYDEVPSLHVHSLLIALRTPVFYLVWLGTNIFFIPTQAQFPGKLRLTLAFSFLFLRLPVVFKLSFLSCTRPLCIETLGQGCNDASPLVLQGGVLGWYHQQDYHPPARISMCPPLVQFPWLLMIVWISDTRFPTNAL